ncbi:MAG: homoserine dehydrogenase, partial [Alphaproteobacteria bacterium]|nr:homoserine dehydrogenase [Alphaproteobacteria bacterium]
MSEVIRVAIAGLGTVGAETVRVLRGNAELLAIRAGRPIDVVAVSARDRSKDRGVDLTGVHWCDNAADLSDRDDVDVVVELIGGSEGIAKDVVERALGSGKSVVTANKALVAHHGGALGATAEANGVTLAFESAVAGGIPIIKTMREGLAANQIERVYGILNGTCNYILSVMRETGRPFADVLADAQELGYAEADPAFDIDGVDAAHKLAILASIAFGTQIDFDAIDIEGIRHVSPVDLEYAQELGYRIKLLGIAERTKAGVQQRVRPCMVPMGALIAQV